MSPPVDRRPIYVRLREPFERWLSMPNYDVVEIVAATVLANRLPGEPLWLALVGPSSSGKTEVVRACGGLKWTHSVGHFTRGTFMSGYKVSDKDKNVYGLLQQMMDGKPHMVLINDFSSVLNKKWDDRSEIMNQFRYLYDGEWDASYGNDVFIRWRGKVGMVVCATGEYERTIGAQAAFGDRFLVCRSAPGDPESIAEKATRNASETEKMRKALNSGMRLVDKVKVPKTQVKLSLDSRQYIAQLTAFVCIARSSVPRDARNALSGVPEIEGAGRTAGQLSQLLRGILLLRGRKEPTLEEMEIIERIALGTIPSFRLKVMQNVDVESGSRYTQLMKDTELPSSVLYRVLEDLRALKLMEHKTVGMSKKGKHLAAPGFGPFFVRTRRSYL
jgi:hypothetical protein